MENITIYPKNEEQKLLLTSLLEEMKIRYELLKNEKKISFTEDEFITKIDKSLRQAASGKIIKLEKDQQKEFLGL
jgi:hypothetical protein